MTRRRGRSSDAVLIPQLVRLWEDNYRVHGVRKLWKAARRAGIDIGRDQTGRLMRVAGLEGATRSRWPAGVAAPHDDLRCHSDAGSQLTSIRYGERLAEIGATPFDRDRRRQLRQCPR